ncbi:PREDICTED: uncharacterized protein LOC107114564 [Gekko japonicus]|uniref:Uncharacterized protein LOC107114564 n=1 Tax=Gekko japonicus TaxID=146911 RepID=A0ABM1KD03_GEKJA|nr:PREDICTED: uncharacterized protein LOC107114564 [Gekko japonicus]
MKDDISVCEPLLEEGDHSNLVPVQRVSYRERLWGILPHRSVIPCLNLWNHLDYGKASFPHKTSKEKATMTEATGPPVKKRICTLLLALIFLAIVLIMLSASYLFFIWSPWSQPAQAEVDWITVCENTTEAILVVPEKLSVATLLKAQSQEPPQRAMRNCLDEAVLKFSEEGVLKKNARMVLQCNGTRREFLSGEGENDIEVVWISGRVEYLVHEASPEVRVARLGRHPLPLNLTTIIGVREDLATQAALEELQDCLDKVVQEFPREPMVVQNSAMLMVSCGADLSFISGEGQTKINVYREDYMNGDIQYQVKATGWAWWARLFTRGST